MYISLSFTHTHTTVIGSLNIDHIFFVDRLPGLGGTYQARSYEQAAKSAIAEHRSCHTRPASSKSQQASASGINVQMVGAVGDDADGKKIREALKEAMLDVSGVRSEEGNTGTCFITVEELDGLPVKNELLRDNRLLYTLGANASLQPAQFAHPRNSSNGTMPDLIIFQLEISQDTVETILKTAHSAGIKVLLIASPANVMAPEVLRCITHLLINQTEAAMIYGCGVDDVNEGSWEGPAIFFLDSGVKNFIMTLGVNGAFYAKFESGTQDVKRPRRLISGHVPAISVTRAVDPTGAGDTFAGAYAAEYVRQIKGCGTWNIEKDVQRACAAGALTVTKAGAQDGIPWADEIDELLDNPSKLVLPQHSEDEEQCESQKRIASG